MQSNDILKVIRKKKLMWQKYHEGSSLEKEKRHEHEKHLLDFDKKHYKGYPRLKTVPLPVPSLSAGAGLKSVLDKRHSQRDFSGREVSLAKVSSLLYFSSGVRSDGKRFYPSAGSLYPLETYILSLNTAIPKGLYHYYVRAHLLEELVLLPGLDIKDYFVQDWLVHASFIVVITACIKRGLQKYGERAYRYMHLEAGHIGQNISLLLPALRLEGCAIGGYYDARLSRLLDVESSDEEVVYAFAVGTAPTT